MPAYNIIYKQNKHTYRFTVNSIVRFFPNTCNKSAAISRKIPPPPNTLTNCHNLSKRRHTQNSREKKKCANENKKNIHSSDPHASVIARVKSRKELWKIKKVYARIYRQRSHVITRAALQRTCSSSSIDTDIYARGPVNHVRRV